MLPRQLLSLIKPTRYKIILKNMSNLSAAAIVSKGMEKFSLPKNLIGNKDNIWMDYDQLADKYKPLNMGGFPDYIPCNYIGDVLSEVATGNHSVHQYTRAFGHLRLVNVLSKLYSKFIGHEINPLNEILVTYGGYEALYCSILGHVDKDDEVIIIEPFFDCYLPMVEAAGGIPRFVPLKQVKKDSLSSADWKLDHTELESLFNEKTKMIILNNPHNPLGKVFKSDELELIAELCKKWNVLCLSDEVYEWMVYKPNKHIRIATLEGMWERTITIGSAGKIFGVTGWKTGWAYGPANLLYNLQMVHQNCLYTCGTVLQEATAIAFEKELARLCQDDCYLTSIAETLEMKRDYMVKFLTEIGMKVVIPEGSYFIIADWSSLEPNIDLSNEKDKYKDYKFTKWMIKNVGLQGIPPSAFYSDKNKHLGENLIRFCFMKKDENLKRAADVLQKLK